MLEQTGTVSYDGEQNKSREKFVSSLVGETLALRSSCLHQGSASATVLI